MEHALNRDKKRLNITWETILGVVAIIGLVVTIVQLRYDVKGVENYFKWENSFSVNQGTSVIQTSKHWSKGDVRYGINQTKGTVKTKYSIYYKKGNGKYIEKYKNGYAAKNNVYYGPYFLHSANGTSKYAYKLTKNTNKNTSSKMIIDLFIN